MSIFITPPSDYHNDRSECLANPTIADEILDIDYEKDVFLELTNQPNGVYEVPPTDNNISTAPPMVSTLDIPPTTHNTTDARLHCYNPTTTHTNVSCPSFEHLSSYTITPTKHNMETYFNSSSCTVPNNRTKTFYDPSNINPFIETCNLASHDRPTITKFSMDTHNAPTLLNSQPPSPSGLPMAPLYLNNQLGQLISASPTYTSYSPDSVVSKMTVNLSSPGMDPSSLKTYSCIDATTGIGELHYIDGAGAEFGFFADTGMAAGQSKALEPCNLGMYSSVPMQPIYDTGNLHVLGDCNQLMDGCNTSMDPLKVTATDISTIEESGFQVPQLTVEEKKKKISRYMEKKTYRNYTKKIKYACRKTLADSRYRVRGRFAKNDEAPQETLRPTRSADQLHYDDGDEYNNEGT